MIQLNARLGRKWDEEPYLVRLTTNRELPAPLRNREALLLSDSESIPHGFRAVFLRETAQADELVFPAQSSAVKLPIALDYVSDGDIVRVVPRHGEMFVLYRQNSPTNSLLLTDQCNSNCLMCSQPPKPHDDSHLVNIWLEAIPLMSRATTAIGITGGEPTLRGDGFLRIVRSCKLNLPNTSLHILSNGRLFNYLGLCHELAQINHPDLMIGIPLYADIAHIHDFVVQARDAFDQTIRGILNLKRFGIRVELRVVLHRQTVERLACLSRFITRNLICVDHVALMGLEMMGHVKMNMDALWIDPVDYQGALVEAVTELDRRRMNVSIYNHQLCVLPRELWRFARKSISDWKNEYLDVCETCALKQQCGGFFSSAKIRRSEHIAPILDANDVFQNPHHAIAT